MKETIKKQGLENEWEIDSAATASWEVGKRPDYRAQEILRKHGITDYTHIARQITKADYNHYDYIFGMDESNMKDLKQKAPKNCRAKLLLLGDFGLPPADRIIRDPYYVINQFNNITYIIIYKCVPITFLFLPFSGFWIRRF